MKIEITGLDKLQEKLDRIGKKTIALAMAAAIKDTAFQVMAAEQGAIKSSFDKPSPWAVQSVKVDIQKANKNQQRATIGVTHNNSRSSSDWKAPGFAPHEVHGGGRKQRPSERILRSAGILPAGMYVVPGRGAWLNSYGNIPAKIMREILASVKALGETSYYFSKRGGKRSASRNRYYIARKAGKATGIWEKLGPNNSVPVLIFIDAPVYKPRFKFFDVGKKSIDANFRNNLKKRISEYLKYDIK